jgi:DNA polymerase-3 subunit epsilon
MHQIPDFVAIDFETANKHTTSACSIGLTKVVRGRVADSRAFLIRPPTDEFGYYETRVHGLRWRDCKNSPTFGELWPEILPWFDGIRFLAAHNAPFDRRVLRACCDHYGLMMPDLPFVDTVKLAKRTWQQPKNSLDVVSARLGIELNHHDAESDAHACAQIIIHAGVEALEPFLG